MGEREMEALEDERAWFEAHGTLLHDESGTEAPPEPDFAHAEPALPLWRFDGRRPL